MLAAADFELVPLLVGLVGGLALFLYGMENMAEALKAVAGDRMKRILGRLTSNRYVGVLTGAFVTAVIQSSSVTTVLVVGFITAGLMSMTQSIGVIMGANIGTTITAQVVAFKVTKLALVMIAVGFGVRMFAKRNRIRNHGKGLLGLGLVFFGMTVMGDATRPLRDYQPFLDAMARMDNPLLGIAAGAAFTALVQSSSATTGVVIVMAKNGFISLPAGIALAFGANIGTCVTALLASIGKPREAVRAATVHVLFNVLGVLIWIGLIDQLAEIVVAISPMSADLQGRARLAADTPRQIANAHTVFNVANTAICIGFATLFARIVERLIPDRPLREAELIRAKYLDPELLSTPALAIDRARLEILRMGDRVKEMMAAILPAVFTGSRASLQEVADMDDAVDALYGHIVTYLGQVSRTELTEAQTRELLNMLEASHDLENIGDIIETNLVTLGVQRIERHVSVSEETKEVIRGLHGAAVKALDASLEAITQETEEAAEAVVAMKDEVNRLADLAAVHQARRLAAQEPNRLGAYMIEMDILENLKRIYYFAKRMARAVERGPEAPGS
ncbi:MAG: Na/Pi cotransporter family protein [Planctomycetota bacterium]|jgi:phosphate:Na+ symporter